jgi:hypothetical protein
VGQDALDHRDLDDREHLLGDRQGERAEPGALAPHEDDRPHGALVGGVVAGVVVEGVEVDGVVVVSPGTVVVDVAFAPTSLRLSSVGSDGGFGMLDSSLDGMKAIVISMLFFGWMSRGSPV